MTWIDCGQDVAVGDAGYLASIDDSNRRSWDRLALYPTPLRTNRSNEERLTGWCGETDNVSKTAKGAWRVVRKNRSGDRAQIVQLKGADLCAFLASDGRPNLIPDDLAGAWNKGIDAGAADAETVLREQGRDAVVATLAPGHVGWDEAAVNAHAHRVDKIPEHLKEVYYRGYAMGARDRAEEIRDGE
jgi:hypothetical protein